MDRCFHKMVTFASFKFEPSGGPLCALVGNFTWLSRESNVCGCANCSITRTEYWEFY